MRLRLLVTLLLGTACRAWATPEVAPAPEEPALALRRAPTTLLLHLSEAVGPAAPPDVVVYLPSDFDPSPPLSVVVYLHGLYNCAENVAGDEDQRCAPGGAVRRAHGLRSQLESSGRNAILIVPEIAFDQRAPGPGPLGDKDGLRRLLEEVLARLRHRLGRVELTDIGRVVVAAHSAGYVAAAAILSRGGVRVDEVYLLDSLYGNLDDFERWMRADLRSFAGPRPARRFASVFCAGPVTRENNEALSEWAASTLPAKPPSVLDDRTDAALPEQTPGVVFKLARLQHHLVPRTYLGPLLRRSGIPRRPRWLASR